MLPQQDVAQWTHVLRRAGHLAHATEPVVIGAGMDETVLQLLAVLEALSEVVVRPGLTALPVLEGESAFSWPPSFTTSLAGLVDRFGHSGERLDLYRAAYALVTSNCFGTSGGDGHFAWCAGILKRGRVRGVLLPSVT